MKKLLLAISILLCFLSSGFSAESRTTLIRRATLSGMNYDNATEYAEIKLKDLSEESLTNKERNKLNRLEKKIAAGEAKLSALEETEPEKAAAKKEKYLKNLEIEAQRVSAREAYEDFIFKNEQIEEIPLNPKTGFPEILNHPFVVFDEGVCFDMLSRLQLQDDYNRSNFVWQDYLIGAYFNVTTMNMKPFNFVGRTCVYYPFYHTFNGMEQFAKQTILYAFDFFTGVQLQADMWKYVRLNLSPGLHYMYQLTDEYHMNYLGGGIIAGIELPIARRWTIINNGTFTLDYANLGTNKKMSPYDLSWSYSVSLGVRYSKKKLNKYAYIHHIEKKEPIVIPESE